MKKMTLEDLLYMEILWDKELIEVIDSDDNVLYHRGKLESIEQEASYDEYKDNYIEVIEPEFDKYLNKVVLKIRF